MACKKGKEKVMMKGRKVRESNQVQSSKKICFAHTLILRSCKASNLMRDLCLAMCDPSELDHSKHTKTMLKVPESSLGNLNALEKRADLLFFIAALCLDL